MCNYAVVCLVAVPWYNDQFAQKVFVIYSPYCKLPLYVIVCFTNQVTSFVIIVVVV